MKIQTLFAVVFAMLFLISAGANAEKPIPPRGFKIEKQKKVMQQKKEPIMILPSCFIQTGPAIVTHPFGVNGSGYGVFGTPLWNTGAMWVMPVGTTFNGTVIYTPLWWATNNDLTKEDNK